MRRNRLAILLSILGVAGILLAVLFHDRGAPVAAIDFRVLQPGAEAAARQFLAGQGVDLAGYSSAVSFETDRDAQNYAERTVGQRALDRIAAGEVTIWRWRVRFYRELEPLEYAVSVLPGGQVVGWGRVLAEAAPGASIDEAAARRLADTVVAGQAGSWQPVGVARDVRPARTDYRFTYEQDGYRVGEATHRFQVTIQGGTVGGAIDFLRVPEAWVRDQRIEANRGVVLATAGWTLTYAIVLGMGVQFLVEWRAGRTRRRVPLLLTAGVTTVSLAALVNQIPVWFTTYPTTASLSGYLIGQVRDQVAGAVPQIIAVGLAAATGLAIWPRAFPHLPNPVHDFSLAGLRSRRFVVSILIGYAAAGAWMGYFTLYYWIGTSVGVWSPVELPYRDVMSGAFPASFPLFVGLSAAITEETVLRLFAISAGALLIWGIAGRFRPVGPRLRTFLLGVVIVVVALIWGSLHSTYPQQPFFIRALEVSVIGILAGALLLRFGLVATLATHYIGNTAIVGALFLLSGNASLQVAAIIVIALPLLLLLPALVARLRTTSDPGFDVVGRASLRANGAVQRMSSDARPAGPRMLGGAAAEEPALAGTAGGHRGPPHEVLAQPALRRLRPLVLGILPAALAVIAVLASVPRPADSLRVGESRDGAVAAANTALNEIGVTPEGWVVLANLSSTSGGVEATYLLRTIGPEATARFYADTLPPALWQVRFSRPLQKDEVTVFLDPNGSPVGFSRVIEEAGAGDSPTPEAARIQADALMARWAPGNWTLVSSSQIRRDARVDSLFVYERAGSTIGEASVRANVSLLGSLPGGVRSYLKVPEAFGRDLTRDTALESGLRSARDLVSIGVLALLAIVFLRAYRRGATSGRLAVLAAAAVGICWLLGQIAGLPSLLAGYINTLDLPTFASYQISLRARDALLLVAGAAALGALARRFSLRDPADGTRTLTLATAGAVLLLAATPILWALRTRLAPATLTAPGGLPPFDSYLPAVVVLAGAAQGAILGGLLIVVLIGVLGRWRWPVLIALAVVWYAADSRGPVDLLFNAMCGAALAALGLLVWEVGGRRPIAVLVALFWAAALRDAAMLAPSGGWLALNALVIVVVATLPAIWIVRTIWRQLGDDPVVASEPSIEERIPG